MKIKNWSDLIVFVKVWKLYLVSMLKWHLRLTKYKPDLKFWGSNGQLWRTAYKGHEKRWIWGREKWDNVIRYQRVPGQIDIKYEYTQKGLGSAGNGNYEFEIPTGLKLKKGRKPGRPKKKRKKRK